VKVVGRNQGLSDLIAAIIRGAALATWLLLPWLIRLAIVALAVYAITGTFVAVLAALGDDFVAFLPAMAITLFPVALALATDWPAPDEAWGRLLASAIIVYLIRIIIRQLGTMIVFAPPALLAFCVVTLLVTTGGDHDRQPRHLDGRVAAVPSGSRPPHLQ